MPAPMPMQQNPMTNPQVFAQMLQQQGMSPQSNLVNNPPPASQPPTGTAPGGQPPQPAPAGAQQMMQHPPMMQQPPLQQPGMAQPRPPVATPQNPSGPQGGIDHQAQAAQLLNQIHALEAQHGSPKPGSKEAAQLNQLKSVLLQGASGGKSAPKPTFKPQEAAALGRLGDTHVVHMTPGEMTVPKELQTPAMLKTMQQEYAKKGVSPHQFTVGSPSASTNPKTGLQEFSFWSSFLPVVGGVVGGVFGGPLGAAAGSTVGGLAGGDSFGQAAMGGALSGVGSYAGGSLFGNSGGLDPSSLFSSSGDSGATAAADEQAAIQSELASDPASQAAQSANNAASNLENVGGNTASVVGSNAGGSSAAAGDNTGLFSKLITPNTTYGGAGLAGAGAALGNMMYQSPQSSSTASPALPAGYNKPMTPVSSLPSIQTLQGQTGNTSYQPPSFNGYNPNTNYTAAYNFFPASNQSTNAAQTTSQQPLYNNYPAS